MPAIYPSTALKNQQREIKSKADAEIVYITENGWSKYVFMSEAVLDATVEQAVQDALYKGHMAAALRKSRHDFEEGRFYSGREELLAAVAKKREAAHVTA